MNVETYCPLCGGLKISSYVDDGRRTFLHCATCALVFVSAAWHLSRADELAQYNLHENTIDDTGYRKFLSRLSEPLVDRLTPGARGLDFGCGPGPALADMLREAGMEVALYDSFYRPDTAVMARHYDFICATEVVEHLHSPGVELDRLWSMLSGGGWLAIMTKLVRDRVAFAQWHYKNDSTHVCFFSAETWTWWARERGATLQIMGADVILLQRNF